MIGIVQYGEKALTSGTVTMKATLCFRRADLGKKVVVSPCISKTHTLFWYLTKHSDSGEKDRRSEYIW